MAEVSTSRQIGRSRQIAMYDSPILDLLARADGPLVYYSDV